jgi:3-oxoacyl-[acyl-carrier protein] reductase
MDLGITGRVAMVAAASKGIGKAIALGLAEEGCRVSLCARTPETLEAAKRDVEAFVGPQDALAVPADVSKAEDLENWYKRTLERFGTVDILVTNTGGPPAAKFMALTDEQWEAGVQSTLMNVVRLCRLVIPTMQEKGWGRILHVTSLVARQPSDDLTISTTLRTGLSALTRTLSNQVAASGITVNAVLPGNTLTDRQTHLANVRAQAQGITPEEALAQTERTIPVGRMAEPREIADAVVFLVSERAAYITGISLLVDGGVCQSPL